MASGHLVVNVLVEVVLCTPYQKVVISSNPLWPHNLLLLGIPVVPNNSNGRPGWKVELGATSEKEKHTTLNTTRSKNQVRSINPL